jgi:hypothetical protein
MPAGRMAEPFHFVRRVVFSGAQNSVLRHPAQEGDGRLFLQLDDFIQAQNPTKAIVCVQVYSANLQMAQNYIRMAVRQ